MTIYVDNTHLGRHVTGLERITLELFSAAALAPLDVVPVRAQGLRQMLTTQTLGLPLRLAASSSILLCPGFPPSPLLRRSMPSSPSARAASSAASNGS